MQQQYFKTMNQTNFSCKKINSSKLPNNTAKNNFHSQNSFRDIEFTDQQASYFKARLPAEFWLIKHNTDQLQKAKEEARCRYLRTKSSIDKFQSMKSKKTVKKIQERAKHVSQIHNQKVWSKQGEKLLEPEKQKKIKKQHHLKKRAPHKINDKKQQNHEQIELDSEGSSQQFHIDEQKIIKELKQENVQKNKKKKEKEKQFDDKDKLKEKEKKSFKSNKELIKDTNLEKVQMGENFQQNIATNQANPLVKESTKSQKNHYTSPSFPTLSSGLPRHIPLPNEQPEGVVESNNLRFLFGLPYYGPMSQQIGKLSQKQKNFCTNIIHKLKAHRSSQAFRVPVDPQVQGVPDYYYVVYNPMDLGSIWKKLLKDKYQDISEFHSDINLIFHNSYKYNLRSTKYFQAAVQFEDYYQTLLKQAEDKPEQYARQYIPKQVKPKIDTGELDYTEHTPLKKKKKRQLDQIKNMQPYLSSKNELLESRRIRGKNKTLPDDHSAFYTHSMALQTVNQFNGQMQMEYETKNNPNFNAFSIQKQKCQQSEIQVPRVKKIQSMKISNSSNEIISEIKDQKKEKTKKEQNFRNVFGQAEGDIINTSFKNSSISFPSSLPICNSQTLPGVMKIPDCQMIEQKEEQMNKNTQIQVNMSLPKKGLNKIQKNRGKRNMSVMMRPIENGNQQNKNEQQKKDKQQRGVNEENGVEQKMDEQRIVMGQQEEKMKMNNEVGLQQHMHMTAYEHYLNPNQGYNYYYNSIHNATPCNNYLMLNGGMNIGSDDDYDPGPMEYYPDYGAYYDEYQPYQLSNNQYVQLPNRTLQPQAESNPDPTFSKQQSTKQETGKMKKRNMIKFPPKEKPSQNILNKQQHSQLKSSNKELQMQWEKQEKMNITGKGIHKKQIEKIIGQFQPLEPSNQIHIEEHMDKSNINLNRNEKKRQDEWNGKNFPMLYNFADKQMKNSHENITINNINEHPPVYVQKHQSGNSNQNMDINMIIQKNTDHQNYSGSTVASNLPIPSRYPDQKYTYPEITKKQNSSLNNNSTDNLSHDHANASKLKSKKMKRKRDEQYQCSSDDQQYNMEEQWKLIRKSQSRHSTRKIRPKIHKQKTKDQRDNNRRGRYGKKNHVSIFDKNSLNLSNTEQTKNAHQIQTNQLSNKQFIQGSNILVGNKDLVKIVKFQDETIHKNIFIESEHESSHFSKRALNLQDCLGMEQLMNHEDLRAQEKQMRDHQINGKLQRFSKEESIYQEYSHEKEGQSFENGAQMKRYEMDVELKQMEEH